MEPGEPAGGVEGGEGAGACWRTGRKKNEDKLSIKDRIVG